MGVWEVLSDQTRAACARANVRPTYKGNWWHWEGLGDGGEGVYEQEMGAGG